MVTKHNLKHHKKRSSSSSGTLIAIIAILVILLVAGFLFVRPLLIKEKYSSYNNFEFEQSNNYWQTYVEYNGYLTPITFTSHPLDLEDIDYETNITSFVLTQPHASFTISMRDDVGSVPVIAGVNIARILGERFYGFNVNSALYFDDHMKNSTNTTIPIVSCNDATSINPIIFIDVNATKNSIKFSDENSNCIVVSSVTSTKENVLSMADLFVYKILEIM